ncbi:phosphoserine phosphatase SerB [soil metagenome]
MTATGFASVILDVDSTICGIEGIDWLAERRGSAVGAKVMALTDRAMRGEIALDAVYGERLALVRPSRDDIRALADAYAGSIADDVARAVARLLGERRRVVMVSGGIREAILPLGRLLDIADADVHAVSVHLDAAGEYAGFDTTSPLATATGKRAVAGSLALPARVLAVGDGATDLAMRPAVDACAAFTGFVTRDPVVRSADFIINSFDQLVELVLA